MGYAAIPDGEIERCGYIMTGTFEDGRAGLDASLEAGLAAHAELTLSYPNAGVGKCPFITIGASQQCTHCACSKLELGTWGERLVELCEEIGSSQSFETVQEKVQGIVRWWDLSSHYMQNNSTPLGKAVQNILAAQETESPFPEGMDTNWALDIQSAQTLDFLAALKKQGSENAVAWDLGTLTGVSAAVLSQHFDEVVTIEREEKLVEFAKKHLEANVKVLQAEIDMWLQMQAGKQADLIFMDLDKACYEHVYELVKKFNLLKPGGLLLCDNVLYQGLPAQIEAGDDVDVSEKTRANAEALLKFNAMVKKDVQEGSMRSLMMPVRDGMLAVMQQ